MDRVHRQGDAKCGAFSFARAFGGNRASVQFNDVSRDRQAQPQTGMLSRAGRISLTKSIEINGRNSWGIPMPESLTATSRYESMRVIFTDTSPLRGVNLTAFDSKFQRTCCRRSASPVTTVA